MPHCRRIPTFTVFAVMLAMTAAPQCVHSQQSRADSLRAVVARMKSSDTAKVNTMLSLAGALSQSDAKEALAVAVRAGKMAAKLRYRRGEAAALYTAGSMEMNLRRYDAALGTLDRSRKLAEKHGVSDVLADALGHIGLVREYMGEPAAALDYYRQAQVICESRGDRNGTAWCLNNIGVIHNKLSRYDDAKRSLRAALEIRESLGNRYDLAVTLGHLGTVHTNTGDYKQALDLLQRSMSVYEALGRKRDMAVACRNIGTVHEYLGTFAEAGQVYTRGLEYAEQAGDEGEATQLRACLANVYLNTGDHRKSIEIYEQCRPFFEGRNDALSMGLVETNIGVAHYYMGDFHEALKQFEKGLQWRERAGDVKNICESLNNLGIIYEDLGTPEQALSYHERALKLREEIGDKSGMTYSLTNIGNIHKNLGQVARALEFHRRSLAISEEIGERSGIADGLVSIGSIHLMKGETREAEKLFRRAMGIYQEMGNRRNAATLHLNIGGMHFGRGEFREALSHYQDALDIFTEVEDKLGMIGAIDGIASVYNEIGSYEKSLDYHIRGETLRRELGYTMNSGQANSLGNLFANMGRLDSAQTFYRAALELARKDDKKEDIATSLSNIGTLYERRGNEAEAMRYFRESLEIREKLGSKRAAESLVQQARQYVREKQFDAAHLFLTRALDIATAAEARRDIEQAHRGFSLYHEAKGDDKAAFAHFRKAVAISDSLLGVENVRSIAELAAKYEAEKKEQQILLLEKDRTIATAELRRQAEELLLRQLEADRSRQHIALLEKQRRIQTLELSRGKVALRLEQAEGEKVARTVSLLKKDKQLQASLLSRQQAVRNSLIAGLGLFVVIGFLTLRRVQGRRREAALRAEAAELQAAAAELQVRASNAEADRLRAEAARAVLTSQENERKRIAGDLHDSVGQEVLVVKNQLYLALKELPPDDPMRRRLEQAERMAESLISDVRRISRNLRPLQLERAGLTETLRDTAHQMAEAAGIYVECAIDPVDDLFDDEAEIGVYRIAQEALNNVVKHAQARSVRVSVRRENGTVLLNIEDDGKGIDESTSQSGLGLRGMAERTALLGGRLAINPAEGGGTRVEVVVPVTRRRNATS